MNAVYALCPTPEAAERAVDGLQGCGLPQESITVLSSEPWEGYRFGQRDSRTRIQWVSVAGGTFGFLAMLALVSFVQISWPLVTGGMPRIPLLPNLIPIFEMTMLGSVLATVGALFVTAGLGRRLPALYDPAISEGRILVGVGAPPPDRLDEIERVLGESGELKRVG